MRHSSLRHTADYIALFIAIGCGLQASGQDRAADPDIAAVEEVLYGQTMAQAVTDLTALLERDPDSETLRFALGTAEFLQSGEQWFSAMYTHGLDFSRGPLMMVMPMLVPPSLQNPDPEPISHEQFREIVRTWIEGVERAEATLAQIDDAGDLKLPLRVGLIRLDFDGSGAAEDDEALWHLFGQVQRRFDPEEGEAQEFTIAFDRGDVNWLRGYCHILVAVGNLILAYDTSTLFDHTAHLFFPGAESSFDFLKEAGQMQEWGFVDVAALIHLLNLPVTEAERSRAARTHLLEAVGQAQQMWTHYDRETDNDREWLPNPDQQSVIPNAVVDAERRDLWLDFLEEAKLVLEGKRLLRFWRSANWMDQVEGRGVNLMRVLEEPRPFDLVLWIQGTAAQPYLEEGTLTEPQLWTRLNAAFDQGVFRYAFWFN